MKKVFIIVVVLVMLLVSLSNISGAADYQHLFSYHIPEVVLEQYRTPPLTIHDIYNKEQTMLRYIKYKNPAVQQVAAMEMVAAFHAAGAKYKIEPYTLLLLADIESDYRSKIASEKKAAGILQVHPYVWGQTLVNVGILETVEDLFKITPNINSGAYILSHYITKARKRGYDPALQRAIIWYLGGNINNHWKDYTAALGEYSNFLIHKIIYQD